MSATFLPKVIKIRQACSNTAIYGGSAIQLPQLNGMASIKYMQTLLTKASIILNPMLFFTLSKVTVSRSRCFCGGTWRSTVGSMTGKAPRPLTFYRKTKSWLHSVVNYYCYSFTGQFSRFKITIFQQIYRKFKDCWNRIFCKSKQHC